MRLLGVSGSLRRGSYNRKLLGIAARQLAPDHELVIYQGLAAVPPYEESLDVDPAPDAVVDLRSSIAEADGVLFSTPEYNGSVPGQLKNALDWASRPFPDNVLREKPVAAVGATTGLFGAVWAQAELRKVLKTIGADVIDEELPVGQVEQAFTGDEQLADPALRARFAELVEKLVQACAKRELESSSR